VTNEFAAQDGILYIMSMRSLWPYDATSIELGFKIWV